MLFDVSGPCKKWAQMAPNGARRIFPTHPDLADILGDMDFDFANLYFWDFCWVPNFWLGPSLGPAWAQLGPGLGPAWPMQLGPNQEK